MQHLPADAAVLRHAAMLAGDAVADAVDAAELFGLEMQQFTRPLALVASDRRWRVERLETAKRQPAQYRAGVYASADRCASI
jgi:hypothetical protein